ncbi:MAG: hypothetical protein J6N49_01555 [Alphaproteobacteria bacterium]|nr:hypothetical protein [Alphaproteobacteria bacterium]
MTDYTKELLFGMRPVRRTNPRPGESSWYYLDPRGADTFDSMKHIDVESETSPNPYADAIQNYLYKNDQYNYKQLYGNTPPPVQTQNNNVQQQTMPEGSEQQITMPKPQEESALDKFVNWAENTGDAMQAGAVGYASGASLGNFDEAMGAANAAVTLNPDNYTMGRDATRQLQNDLQQRHPYIYGGAEVLGATTTSMFTKPILAPVVAGIGYANSLNDIPINIGKNAIVSRYTNGIQKINILPKALRNFGQNVSSEYLLNKEKQEK